jgi:dimethylglycine dehydrogenase
MIVEAGECDAPYMSPVWHDGKIVGETTSGGWGHRIDKSIALGMQSAPISLFPAKSWKSRFSASGTAQPFRKIEPLWDPKE